MTDGGRRTADSATASTIVPIVPRITSHDQAKTSTFVSDSVRSARFTSAITIMATTFARSATRNRRGQPCPRSVGRAP